MISVAISKELDEVEIHLDKEGLERLMDILARLKKKHDHIHLMTPEWGGDELSSESQNPEFIPLNMVTIVSWPEGD